MSEAMNTDEVLERIATDLDNSPDVLGLGGILAMAAR